MKAYVIAVLMYALGALTVAASHRGSGQLARALVECRQDQRDLLRRSVSALSEVSKSLPKVTQVPNKVLVTGR